MIRIAHEHEINDVIRFCDDVLLVSQKFSTDTGTILYFDESHDNLRQDHIEGIFNCIEFCYLNNLTSTLNSLIKKLITWLYHYK